MNNEMGFKKKHYDAVDKIVQKPHRIDYQKELDEVREQMKSCTSGVAMTIFIREEERILKQMNRIESIKERSKEFASNPNVYDWVHGEHYVEDIEYLIQRLERYEKAYNEKAHHDEYGCEYLSVVNGKCMSCNQAAPLPLREDDAPTT